VKPELIADLNKMTPADSVGQDRPAEVDDALAAAGGVGRMLLEGPPQYGTLRPGGRQLHVEITTVSGDAAWRWTRT